MKLVIAMLQHETNTFSPLPTDYEAFGQAIGFPEPPAGAVAIKALGGTNMAIAAFLDLAQEREAEVVLPIAAYAEPGGTVADEAFERIAERICAAVAEGCDAVLLDLHGAMVTRSFDDGEGELLRRIRRIAPSVPIGVTLDFHANVTPAMVEAATVITGYRTYPHVDMYEAGARCGRLLLRCLEGRTEPRMSWGRLPLLSAMLRQATEDEPMRTPMTMAVAAEASGRVASASLFGGFPLSDCPHVSLSCVAVDWPGQEDGAELCRSVLTAAWRAREDFVFHPEPLERTIARAKRLDRGPVVIADYGDNSGAGGQMDDMTVLREILRQGLGDVAAGPIWDPAALAAMQARGVGAEITLAIGGKTDTPLLGIKGEPLTFSGRIKTITEGRFRLTGAMMAGFPVNLDGSAVLDTGALEVIVSGARSEAYSPDYFTHAGIDPTTKRYLVIKSRQHFRAGFQGLAREILMAAGRGACREEFDRIPFKHLTRPIYPLDGDAAWDPTDKLTPSDATMLHSAAVT